MDQTGFSLQAAVAQIQAGGHMSGYVKFTFSKEMMPDSFNGADRMKLSDWEFKKSNFSGGGGLRARGRHLGVDHPKVFFDSSLASRNERHNFHFFCQKVSQAPQLFLQITRFSTIRKSGNCPQILLHHSGLPCTAARPT